MAERRAPPTDAAPARANQEPTRARGACPPRCSEQARGARADPRRPVARAASEAGGGAAG
eukprot:8374865-Alexandrium_andersonii.AAC.1